MQQSNILQHHAHVWIGNSQVIQNQTIAQLQQILCPKQGCSNCSVCQQIAQHQHPWINWLQPDGSYTLSQMDEILEAVRFKLHNNEQRFFIFTQADDLTINCNNRLLKTIEEPHTGYYFIFLITRTDAILPTLTSRCFVKEFDQTTHEHAYEEIIKPFVTATWGNPLEFIKLLDKHEIKERETKNVIDILIQTFHNKLRIIHQQKSNQVDQMLQITDKILILKQALMQLQAPGSTKLFWKNIYLQFHYQQTCTKK